MAGGALDIAYGTSPGTAPTSYTRLISPSVGVVHVNGAAVEMQGNKNAASGYAGLSASSTLADAQVAQSNVTQHQAALTIGPNQVSATVEEETGTTRTAADADHGKRIYCTHASGCTVSFPSGLRSDFSAIYVQMHATSQVTFAAGAGGTVVRAASFASPIKTKEQYGEAVVSHSITPNTYVVTGVLEAA